MYKFSLIRNMGCATSAPEIKIDDPKKLANKGDQIAPASQVSLQISNESLFYIGSTK